MLNPRAFANALAVITAAFYIVFFVIDFLAPAFFVFLFNAQFLGADVASLREPDQGATEFLGILLILVAIGWIFGYLWAWCYNKFSRS